VTHVPEHFRCDHPGCGETLPVGEWGAGVDAGWSGYWTDDSLNELRHHCPAHPVPIRLGEPVRLEDE
jgi:hypothetical protein